MQIFVMSAFALYFCGFAVPQQEAQIHYFSGAQPNEQMGTALAGVGDVDGDGRDDFLVGAVGAKDKGPQAGAALLYSGASSQLLRRLVGDTTGAEFGCAVAGAGDLDGDGTPDLLIGARNHGSGGPLSGALFVYSGKSGALLRQTNGSAAGEQLGAALAGAGDVDGDGVPDYLAGAPGAASQGAATGAARVYSGKTGALIHDLAGPAAGARFGAAVAAAGDWNGDGRSDFLVGAPEEDGAGVVRVYSGRDATVLYTLAGEAPGDQCGAALAGGLDATGDGVPDAVIGIPSSDATGDNSGRVWLISGRDAARVHDFPGLSSGAAFGCSVALLGDWEGDGTAELLLGSRGAAGTGGVWVYSGANGGKLADYKGLAAGDQFGKAVAAAGDLNGDGVADLIVAAPHAARGAPNAGGVWAFAGRQRAAGNPESGAVLPPPAPKKLAADFLDRLAAEHQWPRVVGTGERWVLYGSVNPALLRETALLLDRCYQRLDEVLGGAALGAEAHHDRPAILAFVQHKADVAAVTEVVAGHFPHLEEWASQVGDFPRLQLYNPLLAIVRHSRALEGVKRPEVQLAHMAVQLELARRYGRLPFWIGEAVGYALQDELVDGIYGYSFRQFEALDEEYHQGWKYWAREILAKGGVSVAALAQDSGQSFDQERAYLQFGIASWWFRERPQQLRELLLALQEARGGQAIDHAFEPSAAEQEALFAKVFGAAMAEEAGRYWAAARVTGGPGARVAALLDAFGQVAEKYRLKNHRALKDRIQLFSDFGEAEAKNALRTGEKVLQRVDAALGKPAAAEDAALLVAMIREREAYAALCDAIAAADPSLSGFMARSKSSTGFTIYRPPITVYYHNLSTQEEARPDHNVAHNLVHVELYRRYGFLPLWLAEGLACAGEEGATGEVWANWNLNGFVYTASRSSWRQRAAEFVASQDPEVRTYDYAGLPFGAEPPFVKKPKPALRELYAYAADPYQDNLAHLAYAFATYGMEADRTGLAAFLQALRGEYEKNWVGIGRYTPDPVLVEKLVAESFGGDFEKRFRAFWEKPPERP